MLPDDLDPEIEELIQDSRKPIYHAGSDVAVNVEAPVITGDPAMDTQLENVKRMLCARAKAMHTLMLRVHKIRLWGIERGPGQGMLAPSVVKREDHLLIQTLLQQAARLETTKAIVPEKTVIDKHGEAHTFTDAQTQLSQVNTELKTLSDIQDFGLRIEKLAAEEMKRAQDLIVSFTAMAQQWAIHTDKMAVGGGQSDIELLRLAAQAKPAQIEPPVVP